MYKIRIRPHPENFYLYNVTIYELDKWLGISYWRFYCSNEAIPDWGIDDHINRLKQKHKVIAIDFQLQIVPDYAKTH